MGGKFEVAKNLKNDFKWNEAIELAKSIEEPSKEILVFIGELESEIKEYNRLVRKIQKEVDKADPSRSAVDNLLSMLNKAITLGGEERSKKNGLLKCRAAVLEQLPDSKVIRNDLSRTFVKALVITSAIYFPLLVQYMLRDSSPTVTQSEPISKPVNVKQHITKTARDIPFSRYERDNFIGVNFSPDGNSVLVGTRTGIIRTWDAETGIEGPTRGVFPPESENVTETDLENMVAFSFDGASFLNIGPNENIEVWDVKTGEKKHTLEGRNGGVSGAAFSPDGNSFHSKFSNGVVRIWDANTGEQKLTLKGHAVTVLSVAYSADGSSIASGSGDKTIKIWDAQTGRERLTLKGHGDSVTSVAFSPDCNSIVSGSSDKTIKIWDAKTGKVKLTLKGHETDVSTVAYSPDGRNIASSSRYTVRIWDAKTGKERLTLNQRFFLGLKPKLFSVAFSPDCNSIVSGNDSGIKIWDLTPISSD
ncbi:WD40 repeat domain-containing protein [bacterium]|nr:WD40 repeat domain-containing protein [bacterium]